MATVVEYIVKMNDKLSKGLNKVNTKIKEIDKNISTIGTFVSGAVILGGINKAVDAWDRQAQAVGQVRQGLESTNMIAGRTLSQLEEQAKSLQKNTIFGDESILGGVTAQLLTFTNITGKTFDRTQQAILDVTTRLYGADASAESLRSTSIQLAKALNDPVANLGALSRSGIQFSVQQKEMIKNLVETNRLTEAQNIVLTELEKQYGGSAKAAAKAGKGGFKQVQNRLKDIVEIIGGSLMPGLNALGKVLGKVAGFFEKHEKALRVIIPAIITFVTVIFSLIAAIKAWVAIQTVINVLLTANPIGLIVAAIAGLIAGIIALWNNSEKFRGTILGLWEVMQAFGTYVKQVFSPIMDALGGDFEGLGRAIKEGVIKRLNILLDGIKGIAEAFKLLFKGEFKKAAKEAGKAAINLSGVALVTGKNADELIAAGKKAGDLFKKGFEKGKDAENLENPLDKFLQGGALGGLGSDAANEVQAQVTGAAPKVFNITVQQLTGIENFYNEKATVRETQPNISEAVTEALLEALADIQLSSR